MSGPDAIAFATDVALALLTIALILGIVRLVRGPTLADRILSLDLITTLAVGYIATIAIKTSFTLYLDIAIAIALLGFLSTIALARYLIKAAARRDAGSGDAVQ